MAYEDFLETLTDEEHQRLLAGQAFIGDPAEALRVLSDTLKYEEIGDVKRSWEKRLANMETQEDAAQLIAHVIALQQAMERLNLKLRERIIELHAQQCEKCGPKYREMRKIEKAAKRLLDAAKEAFLQALEDDEDDEPWRASLDEEDEP